MFAPLTLLQYYDAVPCVAPQSGDPGLTPFGQGDVPHLRRFLAWYVLENSERLPACLRPATRLRPAPARNAASRRAAGSTPGVPKPDVPKPDVPKSDVPKPDVPKPDVPKPDVPKSDVPKSDVPKPLRRGGGHPSCAYFGRGCRLNGPTSFHVCVKCKSPVHNMCSGGMEDDAARFCPDCKPP